MKGNHVWIKLVLTLATSFLLAACGGGGGGDGGGAGSGNNVTLSGSMGVITTASAGGFTPLNLSTLPTDYSLFCVTFTDPPVSGSGDFDASGNFSVTLSNAAGLPVGCFINLKATNAPVATISFTVGNPSGFDDGTSDSAAFNAGSYAVTINFNATTGEANVDVRTVATDPAPPPPGGSFLPADLVGEWTMRCAGDNTEAGQAACYEFIPPRIFVDVISADLDTDPIPDGIADETGYAMGVWRSLPTYEAAGRTEGIDLTNTPPEIIAGTLQSLYAPTDPLASVTNPFTAGFTTRTGYDLVNHTMSGDNTVSALAAEGLTYTDTFDDSTGNSCVGALNLATMAGRGCLLQYLQFLSDGVENDVPFDAAGVSKALLIPRVDSSAWEVFVGSSDGAASGATLIQFSEQFSSPDIHARYAMMDLSFSGGALVASQEDNDTYTDNSTGSPVTCNVFHKTVITSTPSASDPAGAVGWFTISEGDSCDPTRAFTATFKVIFTPLTSTVTATPAILAGNYVSACRPEASGGPLGTRSANLQLTDNGDGTADAVVTEFAYVNDRCQGPPASVTVINATLTPLYDRPTAWGGNASVTGIATTGEVITLFDSSLVTQYNTDGAYGITGWALGTPWDVTGLEYDGTSQPAIFHELFHVDANGVLYTGIESRISVFGIADDVQPEFIPVSASPLNLATLDGRRFVQSCRSDIRAEYNALSRSQSFAFDSTAGTITVIETYHSDSSCSFGSRTVEEIQTLPTAAASPAGGQPFTNRGFASPMTASTGGGSFSHTVSVYDALAATGMNGANGGAGAYGINPWANGDLNVSVGTTDFSGVDPGPGSFPVSAWLQGQHLYLAVPEGNDPLNADGYPIAFRNDDPLFEVDTALAIADLDGTWLSVCRDETAGSPASSYDQVAINGGSGTVTSVSFTTNDCTGAGSAPAVVDNFTIDSIGGTVDFGGGGLVFQATVTDTGGKSCGIFQLFGDQLRGTSQAESNGNGNGACEAGEYPAQFAVNDLPLMRNNTPLTATSLPIASFTGFCRDDAINPDEMEFLRIIGDLVVVDTVQFTSTDGTCTGNGSEGNLMAMSLVFGADDVSTARGAATRIDVTDPFTGLTERELVHLEGSFRLFLGDDLGTLDGSGYPTTLQKESLERTF